MSRRVTDPEVLLLASIAGALEPDYVCDDERDPWVGSPFAWIRSRPSRQRGKIGEQLVAGWAAAKGLDVIAGGDVEFDRILGGRKVEIKFSTLWKSGSYVFQQIRNQNYEYVICLGLSPFDAHCWVIPKDLLEEHVIGHTPQHTGRGGTDTFWLFVTVANPPHWLSECGGSLADAFPVLMRIKR